MVRLVVPLASEQIKKLYQQYNFSYIGIDANGVGQGVFEMIQEFARRRQEQLHKQATKSGLVLKVHGLVERGLIEWSEEEKDIAASFLMIKQTSTRSGAKITFYRRPHFTITACGCFTGDCSCN